MIKFQKIMSQNFKFWTVWIWAQFAWNEIVYLLSFVISGTLLPNVTMNATQRKIVCTCEPPKCNGRDYCETFHSVSHYDCKTAKNFFFLCKNFLYLFQYFINTYSFVNYLDYITLYIVKIRAGYKMVQLLWHPLAKSLVSNLLKWDWKLIVF